MEAASFEFLSFELESENSKGESNQGSNGELKSFKLLIDYAHKAYDR